MRRAIAIITFPMMTGLYGVADDFILVVFGEKWLPMLTVLQILAGVGMIQSISTTVGTIYLSTGNVRRLFYVIAASTPLLLIMIVVGLKWGIVGVAIGYALATLTVFYFNIVFALNLVGLSLSRFHAVLWRPFACALVMLFFLRLFGMVLPQLSVVLRLAVLVGSGVLVYALATLAINRVQVMEVARLVASSRRVPANGGAG